MRHRNKVTTYKIVGQHHGQPQGRLSFGPKHLHVTLRLGCCVPLFPSPFSQPSSLSMCLPVWIGSLSQSFALFPTPSLDCSVLFLEFLGWDMYDFLQLPSILLICLCGWEALIAIGQTERCQFVLSNARRLQYACQFALAELSSILSYWIANLRQAGFPRVTMNRLSVALYTTLRWFLVWPRVCVCVGLGLAVPMSCFKSVATCVSSFGFYFLRLQGLKSISFGLWYSGDSKQCLEAKISMKQYLGKESWITFDGLLIHTTLCRLTFGHPLPMLW